MLHLGVTVLNLGEILVRPVRPFEEQRYQELMQEHHYLGSLPKISETLWYVTLWGDQWVALLSFSASALKCTARDRWIGWDFRQMSAWSLTTKYSNSMFSFENKSFKNREILFPLIGKTILFEWKVFTTLGLSSGTYREMGFRILIKYR